ncbi:MAG TPA: hypothetical protein PKX27_06155 [Bacteroidales bacterium]|nr:hypothetical protein [Bacteroidales bacterium]
MKNPVIIFLVTVLLLANACKPKDKSLIIKFEGSSFEQKWAISDLNPDFPSDWSGYGFLTFDMNASSTQRFFINLYDKEGMRRLRVLPFQGAWVRASIPLANFQKRNVVGQDMAAIGQKGMPGYGLGFTGSVGFIKNIDSLGILMENPMGSPVLEVRNMRLTMNPEDSILSPVPLVDEFGQWIPDEWPGKARNIEDLRAAWNEEDKALQTNRFNVSKYGGFLETKSRASGYFRVEKIDGKWWFIDPEGHYFISAGSTGINPGGSFARTEGREYIYASLVPDELIKSQSDKRLGKASFFTWNLYRRFGEDYYQKWMDFTVRRMDDWGLNTIANWSDPGFGRSQRKPYVATLSGWGFNPRTMGMPDVYAPEYVTEVDNAAERQCSPLRNDPYLLGYFVGNEPPWPGREMELINVILEGEDTPMKAALQKFLSGGDTPERRRQFVYDTYTIFIKMVNGAIKKYDPNHLNLGLRFGGRPPEDLVMASASVGFDVFSLNIYNYSAESVLLKRIDEMTGLPIIIGEFHFGTAERGLSPGLRQTISQEERGVAYRYYVENAVAHPSLIGTHWFQWWDQPSTGRGDGENYNIGFIDVTDRPYKELVDAARETHSRLLEIHSGKIPPVSRQAVTQ